MANVDELGKKVVRLKKKLAAIKKGASGEAKKAGADETLRLWHKRLKRAQRRKKSVELEVAHMERKKTKKKTGEEAKAAPGSQEPAA